MDVRSNLRELFVNHTFPLPAVLPTPEEGTCGLITGGMERLPWAEFTKPADVTAYVVNEEGDRILAISKPPRVIVPSFQISTSSEYQRDPAIHEKNREGAILERLAVLLDAAALGGSKQYPVVAPGKALETLRDVLGRPIAALLANRKTAEKLDPGLPVYCYSTTFPDDLVYAVAEPKYVGHVITTPVAEDTKLQVFYIHAALMCHGRVAAVRL